ncbi:MAG: hypothetical protein PVI13_10340 [Desulfobacterales bacterium]|jgi:hypothetical protein
MSGINRFLLKFLILAVMLLGLPLVGVLAAGFPIGQYLEFPPRTRYIVPSPFSWVAFAAISFIILVFVLPLAFRGLRSYQQKSPRRAIQSKSSPFPWWGWLGIIAGLIAWALAWTRFSWFSTYQPHTFSLLWFSYIIVVNALCKVRSGHCLLTARTGFFLVLFPVSAAFWWFFEYLNRFVQNWFYVGADFGPWAYFWYATLPFSTVLPAVLSTRQWFLSQDWIRQAYGNFKPITIPYPYHAALFVLVLSTAGLTGIGIWPNYLFPLLWISPLLIITSLQALMKEDHVFSQLAQGDWSAAVSAALAATVCGLFWEMWNYYSLAKWQYSISLVQRFHIFEMPLLGYAGYLPFGLECAVIGGMLERLISKPKPSNRFVNITSRYMVMFFP